MSDDDVDMRDRAQETDEEWINRLADEADGGNGCIELAEQLSEKREE